MENNINRKLVALSINGFGMFQSYVISKGGIWASPDVYFNQMQAYYTATYKPKYPEESSQDKVIMYNHIKRKLVIAEW